MQWPVTGDAPTGTERLYTDAVFNTDTEYCETYGHDLITGANVTREQHRALRPDGRAVLKAAHHSTPPGAPDDDYPMRLITGRTVHHFHTRTKTGRAEQLESAAPAPWVELATEDAARLGVGDDDLVRVTTPRGSLELPVRVTETREGTVFVPFHYGRQAANELTITAWDPVSKQPQLKFCGARVDPVREA